jgi:WD40 repeat protein
MNRKPQALVAVAGLILAGSAAVSPARAAPAPDRPRAGSPYELIPLDPGTSPGGMVISRHGRYVAMTVRSTAGHTHGQVWVWDRRKQSMVLVSEAIGGGPADKSSKVCDISQDGRFVLFHSGARNLVPNDTNDTGDVFVRDMDLGTTQRVSLSSHDEELKHRSHGGSLTADGRIAFFTTPSKAVPRDHNARPDVYARNLVTGRMNLVSRNSQGHVANHRSDAPLSSDNGRWVAFRSHATNLAAADRRRDWDVYLRDRKTGETRLVSKPPPDHPALSSYAEGISGDGRVVAFDLAAHPWVYYSGTGKRQDLMARYPKATAFADLNSQHGNLVTFETQASLTRRDNTPRRYDVYAMRVRTGDVTLLTRHDPPVGGGNFLGELSRDGHVLVFGTEGHYSSADTDQLPDAYLRNVP